MAALKDFHVSDLGKVPENGAVIFSTNDSSSDFDKEEMMKKDEVGKLRVIGHRGSGMNILQSYDRRMKCYKENSIRSFNHAARFNLDFIEFDGQVTKDDFPVIFHDIQIVTNDDQGNFVEKRVTDITLEEFQSYGPQKNPRKEGKHLLRKAKDGSIFDWKVEIDDPLCTLEEAFNHVEKSVGFNIELKFDDNKHYDEVELKRILQAVLKVVDEHAKGRAIIYSSFHPDATQLVRKLQDNFPVYFLTNGGCEIYTDPRRNSLEEAIKLCVQSRLQGIVSQVKAVLRNSAMVAKIKEFKLFLFTYGQLNNVPEVVYLQHLMGIEGVIVDFVEEIKEAMSQFEKASDEKITKLQSYFDNLVQEQIEESRIKLSDHELVNLRQKLYIRKCTNNVIQ